MFWITRFFLITIFCCVSITNSVFAEERSTGEQEQNQLKGSVQKIVNDWCSKNGFDSSNVQVVSFLAKDGNGNPIFSNTDSWGTSRSGIIYIPYDKSLTANKSRIESILAHESGHATLWNEAKILSNSVFSEMYAMYLGDGGLSVASDRSTAKSNFSKILAAYYGESKTSYTQEEVKECALWCAKNLDNKPTWDEDSTATGIAKNTSASNAITASLIAKIEKQKEREKLLPSDKPTPPTQPSPENGGTGSNGTGNGGTGNAGRAAGKAFIDGKTGSQTGMWHNFNK